ncbi:MAG: NADH-quinone oxidoreductase subunit J [Candidatus Heimdallarchaeota archaeon]
MIILAAYTDVELSLFLVLAFWCLLSALATVQAQNLMRAIVWLINLMIGVGALYIFLAAEFLGMIQLIVYAGGIMVLMLFGIMLTGKDPSYPPSEFVSWKYSLPPALLLLVLGTYAILESEPLLPEDISGNLTPQEALRTVALSLFNDYWIVLLILGLVLLAALIGSVYLIKREVWESKESGLS